MSVAGPDLLGVFAQHKAQAAARKAPYLAHVAEDSMLQWIASAAKKAREDAGRKQVHIAASADKDQSSIYRFEKADGWPRDPDEILRAYAEDLDLHPIDLWGTALENWRASLRATSQPSAEPPGPPDALRRSVEDPAPTPQASPRTRKEQAADSSQAGG